MVFDLFKTNNKIVMIIFFIFIIIFSYTGKNIDAYNGLDHVHYRIGSGGSEIKNLKLKANYSLDEINSADIEFIYDSQNINLEGGWLINFWDKNNYNLNLKLALARGLNTYSWGKGIGITANYLSNENLYYLDTRYFLEKNNKLVIEGGIALPLVSSSRLSLGIGNSYWSDDESDYILNLGLLVKM
ncbi:MAG: hypothetical protein ACOC1O_03770 [bacterium]